MLRTTIILILTLMLVPISIKYIDIPLNAHQLEVLKTLLKVYASVAVICFITGELTKNVSQVDKLWSIIPIVYVWIMAAYGGFDTRLILMAVCVSIWGCRLTYNFMRRGGYSWIPWQGEEDYRWSVLRKQDFLSTRLGWTLFHLLFICVYQMGLILLFCLPMLICYEGIGKPLSFIDYLIAALMIGSVIIEYTADQQQYDFQTEKHRRIKHNEPLGEYAHGYTRTGLWAKVRHPNYAAEQMVWICFYAFSISATGRWLNWTIAGPILLMLLFLGSSDFSEKISLGKYDEYGDYVKSTPRFWPVGFLNKVE
jgi:steroid 5-alpha reductase family enzyme